jgi:hypothetical protein
MPKTEFEAATGRESPRAVEGTSRFNELNYIDRTCPPFFITLVLGLVYLSALARANKMRRMGCIGGLAGLASRSRPHRQPLPCHPCVLTSGRAHRSERRRGRGRAPEWEMTERGAVFSRNDSGVSAGKKAQQSLRRFGTSISMGRRAWSEIPGRNEIDRFTRWLAGKIGRHAHTVIDPRRLSDPT